MVQINIPENPVQELLQVGQSVTVPSGEVWKVTVHTNRESSSWDESYVNGVPFINHYHKTNDSDGQGVQSIETVFVGGDTIECGSRSESDIYISGFEVSGIVDNAPVSEQVDSTNSVTVPSGETWLVNISMGRPTTSWTNFQLNGNRWLSSGPYKMPHTKKVVLTGGDTISHGGVGTDGGMHIGGWVVN